ncbi:MAG: hypothetical protein FWE09_00220 [Treponema sp.]|nr:hypothetical protein [Treponema sp.]
MRRTMAANSPSAPAPAEKSAACAECANGVSRGAECYMAAGVCPRERCAAPLCGECAGSWEYDCSQMAEDKE